jgi:hypothetical protein
LSILLVAYFLLLTISMPAALCHPLKRKRQSKKTSTASRMLKHYKVILFLWASPFFMQVPFVHAGLE